MRLKKQVSLFVISAGLLNALAPAALASTYDAHCNGRKCRVNVDADVWRQLVRSTAQAARRRGFAYFKGSCTLSKLAISNGSLLAAMVV